MSKRQVYVIEGRRKGRAEKWQVQQAFRSRRIAFADLSIYRDGRNPKHVFRCVTYVPVESTE